MRGWCARDFFYDPHPSVHPSTPHAHRLLNPSLPPTPPPHSFQTFKLQNKFDGVGDTGPISYGPCQFPTLGFVVDRFKRIQNFQARPMSYV